ncbi:FAD-dependent oxidoreductase, partial [Vibrio parahaemolyticus]
IGRWSYRWDIHAVSAYSRTSPRFTIYSEGTPTNGAEATAVYDIPADCMMADASVCSNLIVPVCAGFSHVAWAAQRLELA